jgi:hypothetical protein
MFPMPSSRSSVSESCNVVTPSPLFTSGPLPKSRSRWLSRPQHLAATRPQVIATGESIRRHRRGPYGEMCSGSAGASTQGSRVSTFRMLQEICRNGAYAAFERRHVTPFGTRCRIPMKTSDEQHRHRPRRRDGGKLRFSTLSGPTTTPTIMASDWGIFHPGVAYDRLHDSAS